MFSEKILKAGHLETMSSGMQMPYNMIFLMHFKIRIGSLIFLYILVVLKLYFKMAEQVDTLVFQSPLTLHNLQVYLITHLILKMPMRQMPLEIQILQVGTLKNKKAICHKKEDRYVAKLKSVCNKNSNCDTVKVIQYLAQSTYNV